MTSKPIRPRRGISRADLPDVAAHLRRIVEEDRGTQPEE